MRYCRRPESLWADAHLRARPQPRRENHFSGLRTRAFPAGVTARRLPRAVAEETYLSSQFISTVRIKKATSL